MSDEARGPHERGACVPSRRAARTPQRRARAREGAFASWWHRNVLWIHDYFVPSACARSRTGSASPRARDVRAATRTDTTHETGRGCWTCVSCPRVVALWCLLVQRPHYMHAIITMPTVPCVLVNAGGAACTFANEVNRSRDRLTPFPPRETSSEPSMAVGALGRPPGAPPGPPGSARWLPGTA